MFDKMFGCAKVEPGIDYEQLGANLGRRLQIVCRGRHEAQLWGHHQGTHTFVNDALKSFTKLVNGLWFGE